MDELETLIRDLAVRSTGDENVVRYEYFGDRQCLESDSFQEIPLGQDWLFSCATEEEACAFLTSFVSGTVQEWKDKIGGGTTQTTTQTTAQTGIHQSFELTDAQTRIVEYLREHPSASRREIIENSGVAISEDGVKYNLARLQDLRRIKRVGPDFGGHWEVCDWPFASFHFPISVVCRLIWGRTAVNSCSTVVRCPIHSGQWICESTQDAISRSSTSSPTHADAVAAFLKPMEDFVHNIKCHLRVEQNLPFALVTAV